VDLAAFRPYVEATAMGLGVGLEREWSHRNTEQEAAGSRTFAVLGLAGAVAAAFDDVVLAAGALVVGCLLVAGYVRTARADRGTTTEMAAFATYLLGALVRSDAELAIGLAVVMTVLLAAKGAIHHLAREVVTQTELEDALRFFVIAFVVLPLLPNHDVGPYGALNPANIWLLVVAVTGIGWAGYIAVRAFGPHRGLLIAGFAGGFISATATTISMGAIARRDEQSRQAAVGGALLASGATFIQLSIVTAIANAELLERLAPAFAIGLAVLAVEALFLYRRSARRTPTAEQAQNPAPDPPENGTVGQIQRRPFAMWPALTLAIVLTVVLLVARWAADLLGSAGTMVAAGTAGLADVHAAVLAVATLAKGASLSTTTALTATVLAYAANTASKCVVAFVSGGRRYGATLTAALAGPVVVVAGTVLLLQ
jgi:uncharacterized membrane protein (DUF4010 family)